MRIKCRQATESARHVVAGDKPAMEARNFKHIPTTDFGKETIQRAAINYPTVTIASIEYDRWDHHAIGNGGKRHIPNTDMFAKSIGASYAVPLSLKSTPAVRH